MAQSLSDFGKLSVGSALPISGGATIVERYGIKQILDSTFRIINFFAPYGAEDLTPFELPTPEIVETLPNPRLTPNTIPGRPEMTQEPPPLAK